MLKALYDYAIRNQLTLPAGCVKKTIKAYISLTATGQFVGVELADKEEAILCPDIGTLANGTDKSNVLAEKYSIVLPETANNKSTFFLQAMQSAAEAEPKLAACVIALTQEQTADQIIAEMDRHRIKKADRISFLVDGLSILEMPSVMDWWQTFRLQFDKGGKELTRCLITGALAVPATTVPPVQGLAMVGGHASGDTLICFDKSSFCSYGLKQAANAPVSKEAIAVVKAGLDHLLEKAPVLAGMKFVHWYDKPVPEDSDEISGLIEGFQLEQEEASDEPEEPDNENAAGAERAADRLIQSASSGEQPMPLPYEYYILLLSGVGGRVMIRRYEHGSYEQLQRNLRQWWDDLAMTNLKGTGQIKVNKLKAMLLRLLKRHKTDSRPFDRLNRELSGITPAILGAILTGGPLPNAVAVRALAYIRSQMVDVDDETKTPPVPDGMCCQWLKAWLLRENRRKHKEEMDMGYYNANHWEPAYHCGAMVALYGEIQRIAMPDVNVGVVQRYYASASQTPALVLGTLGKMAEHHLGKFESRGLVNYYNDMLSEVAVAIGDRIPVTLTLEQQAYFALGYRQMYAERNRAREEAKANREAAKNAKNEEANHGNSEQI